MKAFVGWLKRTQRVYQAGRKLDLVYRRELAANTEYIRPFVMAVLRDVDEEVVADPRFQKRFEAMLAKCDERVQNFCWSTSFGKA